MKTRAQGAASHPRWSGRSLLASGTLTVVMFGVLPLAHVLSQPDMEALIVLRDIELAPLPPPPPMPVPEPPPAAVELEDPVPIELPMMEPLAESPPLAMEWPSLQPALGFDGGVPVGVGHWRILDQVFEMAEVDVPPRPLVQIPPAYPPGARRSGVEGAVVLEFVVTESGLVEEVRVVESDPGTTFVTASKAAVARWRFEPARFRGDPVAVRVTIPLEFKLGD